MTGYLPQPDRDSAPWWERLADGRFAVQECCSCGALRFPPRAFCAACRTEEWQWREVAPEGTVESWIVSRQPFVPGRRDPYLVVMVRLAAVPGCLVYGNWRAPRPPVPWEPVTGEYVEVAAGVTLLNWAPAGDGSGPGAGADAGTAP
ncbi:zinc ribbon domain-containing protein [Nonomuraea sp. NPDC049421]|uniref:Zn-ribbon domain-containing OB-fold protein n=1 Tax=Nonomuraea sp. NPDC049421 TaxID=3155275 RepID=UPI003417CEDF